MATKGQVVTQVLFPCMDYTASLFSGCPDASNGICSQLLPFFWLKHQQGLSAKPAHSLKVCKSFSPCMFPSLCDIYSTRYLSLEEGMERLQEISLLQETELKMGSQDSFEILPPAASQDRFRVKSYLHQSND